ncbi:hypothetical protein [Azospirillum soli]|uniref:hypothetical protein n=1 Tax=Azospirillum soli TaxID=1304799 RepID=UPI001AE1A4E4|nr:hypothetical protein [Azospirillum soli]MBP2314535.1 hypothetical protein [Azospirillum soli]
MGERHQLWAVAGLLVGRYGDDARDKAKNNAAVAEREGDADAQAIWSDVACMLSHETRHARGAERAG